MNNSSQPDGPIVLGLSGGVDSAVSAALLLEQGYDVRPIFMQNWEADLDDPHCTLTQDLEDAHAVCEHLGLTLEQVNFSDAYWSKVFSLFLDEYAQGLTPNPDILCNQDIKFKAFLDHALNTGATAIATGHYAARRVHSHGAVDLMTNPDANKDQTYFLYRLNQHQLQHARFPLAELTKPQVRARAQQLGLPNQNKKDSTGICFIGERRFQTFLSEYLIAKPGPIQTEDGRTIGQHQGVMYYTLGQRQGLAIGGVANAKEAPWYVIDKNVETNTLTVDQNSNHPRLLSNTLNCRDTHWINPGNTPQPGKTYTARIRHRQTPQLCQIVNYNPEDKTLQVQFNTPQRAAAPGQSLVLYDAECCLGGGFICPI